MPLPQITLKPLRPERYGHPWIFAGEVARGPEPAAVDGGWVQIVDHNGKTAGVGYINTRSKIVVRRVAGVEDALKGDQAEPNSKWWTERIATAHAYRVARGLTGRGFYRLVHAEADGLPGLIVDVYGEFVCVQILTLGMERRKAEIVRALQKVLSPTGIYERSDVAARGLDGLPEQVGVLAGETPPSVLTLEDDGAQILVDIKDGGKTGLFLDQIDNQKAAAREAKGREVLNVFSYTGLFGLRAAFAGAVSVEDVESSAAFQRLAQEQWTVNQSRTKRCRYSQTVGNAFDDLRHRDDAGYRADMIVLDPPAFTKSRASADSALRGYNEINRRALRLLRPGGVLVTCSCSHHLSADEFAAVVLKSARDAHRDVRVIERRGQPPDHPVLLRVPETDYLKVLILAID
jgi:23S rRNA (cytosine1962-C5)-methyltransferase